VKLEMNRLVDEMNNQQNEIVAKMNDLKTKHNVADQERLDAEHKIDELHDQMMRMKYDDNIRHKHVYQTLLHQKADSQQPQQQLKYMLPRRKNLDYCDDIGNHIKPTF